MYKVDLCGLKNMHGVLSMVFLQVLSSRIPFLLSSITDFMLHPPKDKPTVATEIASMAGIACDLDPALTTAMSYHCGE